MYAATKGKTFDEIIEATQPTTNGAALAGSVTVSSSTLSVMAQRLASLRDGGGSGMATGNKGFSGLKVWGQGFGQTAEQRERDNVDGYDADTSGIVFGADTESFGDNLTMGLAVSYADTEVDSNNANRTNTNIKSYQATLYGNYNFNNGHTYFTGMLGYAYGDNDTTRHDVGGVAGLTAKGDFGSSQFLAQIKAEGGGHHIGRFMKLQPNLLANYVHYNPDDYTETGAGGASLVVSNDSSNIFELGGGLSANWKLMHVDGSVLKPEIHIGYRYDLIGDAVATTSSFTGGGASFETEGADPAQGTFNIGAGVQYYSTDSWELSANYDLTVKSDYTAHAGLVKAAYQLQ